MHLLCECSEVLPIWEQTYSLIKQIDPGCEPILTTETILFNRIVDSKFHVANFVCLIVKQYIYAQKVSWEHVIILCVKK